MDSKKICYTCDLKDDPKLISEYKKYHEAVWPQILESIVDSGILNMDIYLFANRLFMIMEVPSNYDPEIKQKMDAINPKVQEWEKLIWNYQQALPNAKKGEKWMKMERIFSLNQ